MLTEPEVIASVCRFLKKNRFRAIRFLSETEHGIDIQALAPDGKTKVSIEAKGKRVDVSNQPLRTSVFLFAGYGSCGESGLTRCSRCFRRIAGGSCPAEESASRRLRSEDFSGTQETADRSVLGSAEQESGDRAHLGNVGHQSHRATKSGRRTKATRLRP
jgi:hypothetical protein